MKALLLHFNVLVTVCFAAVSQTMGQSADETTKAGSMPLFDTIAHMDKTMFDALDSHNVDALMTLFSDDLEFYHDQGGVTNYQQTAENFKKMFANNPGIRRDLVQGSLEVYPLKDYGAIEVGTHRFCHQENGKDDCGSFKFVMVWRNTGNSWKVSRVISYGH
jgi:ketosteroid isomerase-like protein